MISDAALTIDGTTANTANVSPGVSAFGAPAFVYGSVVEGMDVKITAAAVITFGVGAVLPDSIESELAGYEGKISFENVKAKAATTVTYAADATLAIAGDLDVVDETADSSIGMVSGSVKFNTLKIAAAIDVAVISDAALTIDGTATNTANVTVLSTVPYTTNIFAYGNILEDETIKYVAGANTVTWGAGASGPMSISLLSAAVDGTVLASVTNISPATNTSVVFGSDSAKMTINGKVLIENQSVLAGSFDLLASSALTVDEDAAVTWNGTLSMVDTATIAVLAGANVSGTGSINATHGTITIDADAVVSITITKVTDETTVASIDELVNMLASHQNLRLTADIELNKDVYIIYNNVINLDGHDIIVPADYTLTITKSTIKDTGRGTISVEGILAMDDSYVYANVDADEDAYVSIVNAHNDTVSGNITADSPVGYGDTRTYNNVTIANGAFSKVWGKQVFEGTSSIAAGAYFYVYECGTSTIAGSLAIQGTSTIYGYVDVTGSLSITNDNGGAVMTVDGMVEIENGATMTVVKPRASTASVNNVLMVGTDGIVAVEGSMEVTGKVDGTIDAVGTAATMLGASLLPTVVFNGTAGDDAKIRIYDENYVLITSVSGTLTVFDDENILAADILNSDYTYKENIGIAVGNEVVLNNVRGVIVSEEVQVSVKELKNTDGDYETVKFYTAVMSVDTVDGSVNSLNKDTPGRLTINADAEKEFPNVTTAAKFSFPSSIYGYVDVDDMNVGKNTTLALRGANDINLNGDIVFNAECSNIDNTASKAYVKSSVTIGPKAGASKNAAGAIQPVTAIGTLHSGHYTVTNEDGDETYYYYPLAIAIQNSAAADDGNVYLMGTNKVTSDMTIPDDISLIFDNAKSVMTIGSSATVTVSEDAVLDGSAGKIVVNGSLVIMDKNNGLKYNTAAGMFVYQVYTENGDVATYTGLLGALENAKAGDTISIVQDATIDESVVIKEGVTLIIPKNRTITAEGEDKIVITVNGQLFVMNGGYLVIGTEMEEDVEIVANGAVGTIGEDGIDEDILMDNYVAFEGKIDGRTAYMASNLTYAALNNTGTIMFVYGDVSADTILLAPYGKETQLNVFFVKHEVSGEEVESTMVVSALTLTDGVKIFTTNGKVSANTTAESVLDDAVVVLSKATGIIIEADSIETATGVEDYLYVSGILEGSMTITDGVVTVNDAFATAGTTTSKLTVGADAVLVVASGETMAVASSTATNVSIAGTIIVNGTLNVNGPMSISGEMDVYKAKSGDAAKVSVTKNMTLTGVINVSIDTTYGGTFEIDDAKLTLGTAAKSVGATPAFVGKVTLKDDAFIVAYAGSDMSAALVNWNSVTSESDAEVTAVYVFSTLYATAYAADGTAVDIVGTVITSSTTLSGYDVKNSYDALNADGKYAYWFTDSAMKTNASKSNTIVGNKATLYFAPGPASIYGKVTVGTGINLYIDGKVYEEQKYYPYSDYFTVGTHSVYVEALSGYVDDGVTIKFNGSNIPVTKTGGTFTITADMESFTLVADGAAPYTPEPTPEPEKESEWTITTILLCILVVLIAIMAVIVALRLNRQ